MLLSSSFEKHRKKDQNLLIMIHYDDE